MTVARLNYFDRAFKKRLDKAKGHFGTATTQTDIPAEQRQASVEAVREFLVSLEPQPCEHPRREATATVSGDGSSSGRWTCKDCGAEETWTNSRPAPFTPTIAQL